MPKVYNHSQEIKEYLRALAIKNNFGGNTHDKQQRYSDMALASLIEIYYQSENKLKSLFDGKILKTNSSWKDNVARYLDKESRNKLYFQIEVLESGTCYCNYCKIKLTVADFDYTRGYRNKRYGFGKYCKSCSKKRIFVTKEGNIKDFCKLKKTLSIALTKFYTTKKGIQIKKRTGQINSKKLKRYFSTEKGIAQIEKSKIVNSVKMREKIANGEFSPKITNSWTHWSATAMLKGIEYKFRSSWEACFFISNQSKYALEYETLRIPYIDNIGIARTYIGDFFDRDRSILFELKPRASFIKQQQKMNTVINYCISHNIKFIWINESNILNYIDEDKFDENNIIQYGKLIKGIKNGKAKN